MDINLVNIFTALICVVVGYFFGSIPNGVWIGKLFFHKDIRDYGSHNSGGTNAGRILGKKIGLLVIALDMLKTLGTMYAVWAILTFTPLHQYYLFPDAPAIFQDITPLYYWIVGLMASIGHCWSIFLGFKGGKAAANLMGMSTGTSWLGFATGFVYLGLLRFKKIVSLSSIIGGGAEALVAWIVFILEATIGFNSSFFSWTFALGDNALRYSLWGAIVITLVWILLVIRHRANIQRMRQGTESKVKLFDKKPANEEVKSAERNPSDAK